MTSDPHRQTSPAASAHADDEISLWLILAVLVRRRWTIVGTTFVVGVLSVGSGYLATYYSTFATFRPQESEIGGSELAALAGQFGVSVPGAAGEGPSSQFYVELLRSRAILGSVADRTYDVEELGEMTLVELLEIEEPTPGLERRRVLEWLREEAVAARVATETGTVTVEVVTEWPEVSYQMAQQLLGLVTDFNMTTRRSSAAEERRFIQARVDSARTELTKAETELQSFLEANVRIDNAPQLLFEQDRLQREVAQRQSVLTTLVQSYEQARIQEVRDTPVITVISEPFMPPGRDPRGTVLRAAIGFVLGVSLGILLAFVLEAVTRPADGDESRAEFLESWRDFIRSLPLVGRKA